MSETLTERDTYLKNVACQIHTFPIMGCERCWNRLLDEVERLRRLERSTAGKYAAPKLAEAVHVGPPPGMKPIKG